ncbi:MAG: hypothetical protein R3A47_02515 [Polyangiales bacterium]
MTLKGDGIGNPPVAPKDASTIVLLRDDPAGLQTFMMCRHQRSGFLGGAHVFPGGKLDDDDMSAALHERVDGVDPQTLLAELGEELPLERAVGLALAAVRETLEEAGVLFGTLTDAHQLAAARQQLNDRVPFTQVAAQHDLRFDLRALHPYARWITPIIENRRFDTRFYVATVPEGQIAEPDGTETVSASWMTPAQTLDRAKNGELVLAPPTQKTLEYLANFATSNAVIADVHTRLPPLVDPEVVMHEKGWFLALPGDEAHPRSARSIPGATRLILKEGRWVDFS